MLLVYLTLSVWIVGIGQAPIADPSKLDMTAFGLAVSPDGLVLASLHMVDTKEDNDGVGTLASISRGIIYPVYSTPLWMSRGSFNSAHYVERPVAARVHGCNLLTVLTAGPPCKQVQPAAAVDHLPLHDELMSQAEALRGRLFGRATQLQLNELNDLLRCFSRSPVNHNVATQLLAPPAHSRDSSAAFSAGWQWLVDSQAALQWINMLQYCALYALRPELSVINGQLMFPLPRVVGGSASDALTMAQAITVIQSLLRAIYFWRSLMATASSDEDRSLLRIRARYVELLLQSAATPGSGAYGKPLAQQAAQILRSSAPASQDSGSAAVSASSEKTWTEDDTEAAVERCCAVCSEPVTELAGPQLSLVCTRGHRSHVCARTLMPITTPWHRVCPLCHSRYAPMSAVGSPAVSSATAAQPMPVTTLTKEACIFCNATLVEAIFIR